MRGRSLNIGIVGCGTAGPAAAAFLHRLGHRVTIYERSTRLEPIGAGLLLQPTGMAVLQSLGVLDEMLRLGHRIDHLRGRNERGRTIMDLSYSDLRPGLFGLGVHRGGLFTTLLDLVNRLGISVHTGISIERARLVHDRAILIDAAHNEHGPFDLVIVADGARSQLRSRLFEVQRHQTYDWAALWCVTRLTDPRFQSTLSQVYRGTDRMIGFLPTGRATPDSPATISIFWSLPRHAFEGVRSAGLEAWKREACELAPHAAGLLAQVRSIDELVFASYQDVVLASPSAPPFVSLGDSAHAMSPQLGQGANLALVDAAELAACIESASDAKQSLAAALNMFAERRRDHQRFYTIASRWLTPWFQSDMHWLAPVRDAIYHPCSRVGWVRRQMLASLAGIKTGPLTSRPLPPEFSETEFS